MTFSATKFDVATSKGLGGDAFKKNQYLTFDLDLGVKVTRNFAQYPLYYVTFSARKFEVAMFKRRYIYKKIHCLTDTFTRK